MSTSPIPSRRLNNANGRSRSPSPAANSILHSIVVPHNQPNTASTQARNNFLSPENSDLYRARRSVPAEANEIKTGIRVPETMPLIDAENFNPPLANPETDDMDDREVVNAAYPGVDDGFFSNRANDDGPTVPGSESVPPSIAGDPVDDPDGRRVFPSRGVTPRLPMSPTRPTMPDYGFELGGLPTDLESIPDVNVYQHKKTLAQGMMDLALFSANANQLRYVVESDQHPYFYSGVILISISLILQVAIGVGLIWNSRYNVKDEKEICIANKISNFTIIGIFIVTVVNVFISAFGVASTPQAAAVTSP